ncbi:MAG: NADH-quinone oxidoreductase subunit L [Chloroflexota bacterium]|nr:NADH-quinone oxidoreductase subunit L [Chloroflexota bacterium]
MENFLWVIPAAPLAAFIITILFGRGVLKSQAHWPGIIGVGISFVCAVLTFFNVVGLKAGESLNNHLFTWMDTGSYTFDSRQFNVPVTLHADHLTAVMLLVVTSVGFLVHVYSVGYMHGDGGYYRFFSYLPLFVFSMLMLVLANSYLLLFAFWEAVGLCSYLLVGFWFHRPDANNAAMKAFWTTRVGDIGFGLGTMLVWTTFGTFTYTDVFSQLNDRMKAGTISHNLITIICLLLFCGAIGKSAQVPLQTWLPDAMLAPTPVSALIHAATMVTAGIYLVARSWPLFDLSPGARDVVAIVGITTAVLGATIGIVQRDIKRVLAYSTISQLGYMCFALGVGAYIPAIFHLATHAMFKGLMFLGSGSVIHGMHEEQDLFKMGGLRKKMPITAYTFLIGALAISGVTGLAGFWSKDEIIVGSFHAGYPVIAVLGLITAGLTAFYMFRLYFLAFEGKPRYDEEHVHPHESPATMTIPLIILAIPSVVIGALLGWPPDAGAIHTFLGKTIQSTIVEDAHGAVSTSTSWTFGIISSLVALGGIFLAFAMYMRLTPNPYKLGDRLHWLWTFLWHKWYFDEIYNAIFVQGTLALAMACWAFDRYVVDGAVNGVATVISRSSGRLRRVQTGFVANYALVIALGAVLIVGVYLIARGDIFTQLFG